MVVPFVDLGAQYVSIKAEIDKAIEYVIRDTAFVGGRYVEEFEKRFADIYGIRHCIGVGNGTDAIYIVLKMLGIGVGDEVITVANSWISTSETISQTGATPVFVDIEPNFFTLDPLLVEEKITPKTRAVIPVHLYGHPADMDPILELCREYNLHLVEDCAQAHFAEYKGKRVGLFGDAATFSFYPGKNLGAYGDAGAIITNDDELAEKIRRYANHGSLEKHDHKLEGINSRMDGMQAAILSVKLTYISKWTSARRRIAATYRNLLQGIEEVKLPKEADYAAAVYHLYVIRCKERDKLREYLLNRGIGTGIHYPTPLPLLEAYERLGYGKDEIPKSAICAEEVLSLPMYAEMTDEMIAYVASCIEKFYHAEKHA